MTKNAPDDCVLVGVEGVRYVLEAFGVESLRQNMASLGINCLTPIYSRYDEHQIHIGIFEMSGLYGL